MPADRPIPGVLSFYDKVPEESRLASGHGRLEFERTREILARVLPDFVARWDDPALRRDLLDVARALESEPSAIGVSAHLLGIARKP